MSMKYISYNTKSNPDDIVVKINNYMSKYGVCARPTKTSWIAFIGRSAAELRDELSEFVDGEDDSLMILEWSANDHATIGMPKEVDKWLVEQSRISKQFA